MKRLLLGCGFGLLMTLPLFCLAAGPGQGSMTKHNVRIGNCVADSITIKWNLDSLMGEPTVNGSFQWETNSQCSLPPSTTIWLKVEDEGGTSGYIDLRPVTPKANNGYGYNTTGSPNWNSILCGSSGVHATKCHDEKTAKKVWKSGKVTDFNVAWESTGKDAETQESAKKIVASTPILPTDQPQKRDMDVSPVGTWDGVVEPASKVLLVINADGTGTFAGEYPLLWSRQGNQISVRIFVNQERMRRNQLGQSYELKLMGTVMEGTQFAPVAKFNNLSARFNRQN